ncbi:acyl-CoA thioesterase [Pseudoalteromonas aurantia]|uniref:Acyl-CoA thioester hydrolase n=1 Tax=Pseudoalteromonas aurantia 208 TaxID=1314867 RepID=A0ABR9E7I0_9GAMM|nr:thioesterase family protein [Pseudoalteromonas aurantia]MBE0366906.1 acyl-CoA thioester hydrolase [Pseudoalteromonas aurantia 208]
MHEFFEKFAINTKVNVVWGEMDALGHVNNVSYFRYFETARIDFLSQTGLLSILSEPSHSPVLRDTYAQYKRPVTFPDTLHIGSYITDIKEDRFTMRYEAFSESQQAICTTGYASVVMFNMNSGQKAAIPSNMLTILKQYTLDNNRN